MGQAQSSSSALPSRELLLAKTKGGPAIIKVLFEWLIAQANIRDFYLMANPEQCKRYILLTADVLNESFIRVGVSPEEGPKGTVVLQDISKLIPTDPSSAKGKLRQFNCTRLAFLYIRIFQIFAALSLTVLDVDPSSEQALLRSMQAINDTRAPLFGQQRGGALDAKKYLPYPFEQLRGSLSEVPQNPSYYKFTGTQIYIEYLKGTELDLPIIYNYSAQQNGKLEDKSIVGKISVEVKDSRTMVVYLKDLKIQSRTESKEIPSTSITFNKFKIEDPWTGPERRDMPSALAVRFMKLAKGDTGEQEDQEDGSRGYREPGVSVYKGFEQFERDMGQVPEGFHTKTILRAFNQIPPPKAHCMARALQLVSETGLRTQFPEEIYSSLCKTKFMVSSSSLPPAGDKISKEVGIYALAQLFYDTLENNLPRISATTQEQYKAFLAKMKFVFEESKDTKAIQQADGKSFESVINKLPSGACTKEMLDRSLKLKNRELIRQLRGTVSQMITYQIAHTANVTRILQKLFYLPVKKGEKLSINPRVLKYGMKEVSAIGEEARELLIEYYSRCEILYRSGAEIVAANKTLITPV